MREGCGLCRRYGRGCQYHPDEPAVQTGQHKKAPSTPAERTVAAKDRFIAAYLETATISHACELAEVGRQTHYDWLREDPEYKVRFAEAEEATTEDLEAEARRRALEGVREPVGFYKGTATEYVQRYSDTLLIFLLKARRPDVYRERFELAVTEAAQRLRESERPKLLRALQEANITAEQVATIQAILQEADAANGATVH